MRQRGGSPQRRARRAQQSREHQQEEQRRHARPVEQALGQADRRKPHSAASSAAQNKSPLHIPAAIRVRDIATRDRDGQHPEPALLEQDLHPEIEDVPRQVVVGREEPARAAAGKVAVGDEIGAGLVDQPQIVDVDDAVRAARWRGSARRDAAGATDPSRPRPASNAASWCSQRVPAALHAEAAAPCTGTTAGGSSRRATRRRPPWARAAQIERERVVLARRQRTTRCPRKSGFPEPRRTKPLPPSRS